MSNNLLSNRLVLADAIFPAEHTTGAKNGAWLPMKKVGKLLAIVQTGTLGTNATIDFKLQQATNSSGDDAKDITGKAITQLSEANCPADNDSHAIINLHPSELDIDNDFNYVRMVMTVGTDASPCSAFVLTGDMDIESVTQGDSVAEVIE
jgi:hypothetical protein